MKANIEVNLEAEREGLNSALDALLSDPTEVNADQFNQQAAAFNRAARAKWKSE